MTIKYISAPKLSHISATPLLNNNTLKIEWELEYTGGSHDVHMTITIQSNAPRRKRSLTPVTLVYNVDVHDNTLITSSLPYGLRYDISSMVSNEYGYREHNTIGNVIRKKTFFYYKLYLQLLLVYKIHFIALSHLVQLVNGNYRMVLCFIKHH